MTKEQKIEMILDIVESIDHTIVDRVCYVRDFLQLLKEETIDLILKEIDLKELEEQKMIRRIND